MRIPQKWSRWYRKNKLILRWVIPFIIFLTIYLGGIISQVFGRPLLSEEPIYLDPINAILANFKKGPTGILILLAVYLFIFIALWIKSIDPTNRDTSKDPRGFDLENSGALGSRHILSPEETREVIEVEPFERTTGIILGRYITEENPNSLKQILSLPLDGMRFKYDVLGRPVIKERVNGQPVYEREKISQASGNRHMAVTGTSGSGKSSCFALNEIFMSIRYGHSLLITDPKGELYKITAAYAASQGYVVKILNLLNPTASDSWDVIGSIMGSTHPIIEAQKLSHTIIKNTADPNSRDQYSSAYENLLTAFILYVMTAADLDTLSDAFGNKYTRTLGTTYELVSKSEEELCDLFEQLKLTDPANPSIKPWDNFISGGDRFRSNTKSGLALRLQTLQDKAIQNIVGFQDIDLLLPGTAKCAYYVVLSDIDKTFKFISSLFFTSIFNKLVEYSRNIPGERLPQTINCVFDEFTAIGSITDFATKMAVIRSAGFNVIMLFQTISHLVEEYPDEAWKVLLSNCGTFICFGNSDADTTKFFSEKAGKTTIETERTSYNQPTFSPLFIAPNSSRAFSLQQRDLLQPTDIAELFLKNKVLIFANASNPIIADKLHYTALVDPSKLILSVHNEHIPAWAQHEYPNTPKRKEEPTFTDSYESTTSAPENQGDNPVQEEAPVVANTPVPEQVTPPVQEGIPVQKGLVTPQASPVPMDESQKPVQEGNPVKQQGRAKATTKEPVDTSAKQGQNQAKKKNPSQQGKPPQLPKEISLAPPVPKNQNLDDLAREMIPQVNDKDLQKAAPIELQDAASGSPKPKRQRSRSNIDDAGRKF